MYPVVPGSGADAECRVNRLCVREVGRPACSLGTCLLRLQGHRLVGHVLSRRGVHGVHGDHAEGECNDCEHAEHAEQPAPTCGESANDCSVRTHGETQPTFLSLVCIRDGRRIDQLRTKRLIAREASSNFSSDTECSDDGCTRH